MMQITNRTTRRCPSRNRGFTLIELLVYIAVMALTLVVVIVALSSFARVYGRTSASQSLARSGASAMERIVREARNAQSIDQTASTFGTHPGRLTVVTPVSPGVTRSSEFSVVNGAVRLSEDGSVVGTITSGDVTVESLVFYRIATSHSEAVRVLLTLSKTVGTSTITASFYDTGVLRGSYAL
jgi:type II secretory pathway pseudopilin PulG